MPICLHVVYGCSPTVEQVQHRCSASELEIFTIWLFTKVCQSLASTSNGSPLQYFWLDNPMDEGAWWAVVHGVAKSWARLSDLTFTFHFHALEKEMATHSSVLAWRIPGRKEPDGLPSMGSYRVGHDWSNLAAAAATSTSASQPLMCIESLGGPV